MNNDWEKYGKDIRNLVENAISSQNFHQLNKNITDSVNEAVNDIQKGIKAAGKAVTDAANRTARFDWGTYQYKKGHPNTIYHNQSAPYNQSAPQHPQYAQPSNWQTRPQAASTKGQLRTIPPKNELANPAFFQKNTSVSAGGWALAVCGYTCGFGTGIAVLVLCMVALFLDVVPVGIKIALAILIPLFAGSSLMAWKGSSMLSALKRYRGYISALHGRTYCNIKELSDRNGKSPQYVLKDLQKMISKGWFRQGHLDQDNTCLIVSHDTYQQYQNLQQRKEQERLELQQQEEQKKIQESDGMGQVIEEGKAYLEKIRECNDAIPGEEISQKISRIEMLVQKIFERVGENPDSLEDIHKLMEYYLPTTVKLLEAYRQLGCQPIQGENIRSSKEEIEKTLDTLNIAFEKLLDSLFEDVAWDVSTDISVLHSVLAQEGLAEDDFSKEK